jgi:outer membrane lipoprotein-sorting protein
MSFTPSNKVMKRLSLLVACLGIMSLTHADEASDWVRAGLEDLNTQKTISIDLAGTYTYGDTVQALRTQLFFKTSFDTDGKQIDRLECVDYVDGTMTHRIVGDGMTLWSFNVDTNQYSATTYGSYTKVQAEGYARKLFQGFMSESKGQTTYLARLMLDARGYDLVKYSPWIPAATPEVANFVTSIRVRYLDGNPAKRILTYLVSNGSTGVYKLTALGYWDTSTLGAKQRSTQWLANITTEVKIDDSHFVFNPPIGAKPIVTSKAVQ